MKVVDYLKILLLLEEEADNTKLARIVKDEDGGRMTKIGGRC